MRAVAEATGVHSVSLLGLLLELLVALLLLLVSPASSFRLAAMSSSVDESLLPLRRLPGAGSFLGVF